MPEGANLVELVGHEFLAAEPGFDAHDEHQIEFVERGKVGFDGGAGAEGEAGLNAGGPNVAGEGNRIVGGLHVEDDVVRAGLDVVVHPAFGVVDHEVHVEGLGGGAPGGGGDVGAEGKIRDEVPVHDVDVNPVGVGDSLDVGTQVGEVGGQDGGGNDGGCHDCYPSFSGVFFKTAKNMASVWWR